MTITIKQIQEIDEFTDFYAEYLTTVYNLKDTEKLNQYIKDLRLVFAEGNRTIFVAYQEKKPVGFISGKNEGEIFETSVFYIKEIDNIINCGYKLITALANKAFELGYGFYRQSITLPSNFEPTLENSLKEDGFYVHPRVGMLIKLNKRKKLDTTLPENYSYEPFSMDRIDEIFQLMKDANPPEHTDSQIYPEMLDPAKSKKIFSGFSEGFTKIDSDINPQIIFENKLVGLSFVLEQNPKIVFVAEVCISPQHQRKGLGKAIMNKIISECASKGYKKLGLAVTVENTGAYKLYEKLGFKIQSNYLSISKQNK